jgi:hypothetical protein
MGLRHRLGMGILLPIQTMNSLHPQGGIKTPACVCILLDSLCFHFTPIAKVAIGVSFPYSWKKYTSVS